MSDQDFFFDEDEKPADKSAKAPAKQTAKQPAKKAAPAAAPGGIELTWTVTALIGIVALLLGVIVGYAIPKGAQQVGTTGTTAGAAQQQAPQLSPDQMSSGELPAGHPDISGASGGSTGSAETTAK